MLSRQYREAMNRLKRRKAEFHNTLFQKFLNTNMSIGKYLQEAEKIDRWYTAAVLELWKEGATHDTEAA